LSLEPKIDPKTMAFEPHCYITARTVDQEITEAWLVKNNFPLAPVYTVGFGGSKVEVAKKSGLDIFVDDSYKNFIELNRAGVCTYLFDTPQNSRYNVGHKRIKCLSELV
jgi:uncharacterized HAD superfamily protein